MILTGPEIAKQVRNGQIKIAPYRKAHLNPNSYDFLLGSRLLVYKNREIDSLSDNPVDEIFIKSEGIKLYPEIIYLGHTVEIFASDYFVPILFAKSSVARLGLFVHVTANLIDIGFSGQWTLQLHCVQPIRVYPKMRIGQATFWKPLGEITLYNGKYQNSSGPQAMKAP